MAGFSTDHKRIAKNTVFLYFRTFLIMLISLYTSRVILKSLGIEDYGIYNVVGGVVAMFSVISSSLSAAISRFMTYELGKGDSKRLSLVFCTSVNIQAIISVITLILGETIGVWFLNYQMNIPLARLTAANWVLQCSLFSFCIGLLSVPYNACIIAHEKMSVYAYISILESLLKLSICYLLAVTNFDRLITYAILMVSVSLTIRFVYGLYCNRHFSESRYSFIFDKSTFLEMMRFANWSFFTNVAWILNTQGLNMLINIFFGVTLNAARAVATQVEGTMTQFVNSFTTALNPQITKSYANNQQDELFLLVSRGARFSYLMVFLLALPIMIDADFVLHLWLDIVPEYAVVFVRLSLISVLVYVLGNSSYVACMATGNIKKYSLWVTIVGFLVFPLTWLVFYLGGAPEAAYYIYILVYIGVDITRLLIMRGLLNYPIALFVKDVIYPIFLTSVISVIIPLSISQYFKDSLPGLFFICFLCFVSSGLSIYWFGITKKERKFIEERVLSIIRI